MINMTLMLYCLVLGGGYLLIMTLILEVIGRALKITRGIPPEMVETAGLGMFIVNFIMEGLFFVAIPTMGYGFFAVVLPLAGIRPAIALALVSFTLGAVPVMMGLAMRIRLSMPYLLYHLLAELLKLGGCIAIIGYLYSL